MPLECSRDDSRLFAIPAGRRNFIAIGGKLPLETLHFRALVAEAETRITLDARRFDPMTDPGTGKPRPVEFLPWIALPMRRNVGMGENPVRPDAVSCNNV